MKQKQMLDVIEKLQTQLNWKGPTGREQSVITLSREDASLLYYVATTAAAAGQGATQPDP